jgi:hypothetical protein
MDYRERQSLDRYITGNYGEDQFKGEAEFEAETDRLLNLRDKALRGIGSLQEVEADLDSHCPDWRECLEE